MRGASARSLAATLEAVDTAVGAAADATAVGDELFAVVEVLDGAPGLRKILTDPSTETAAQEGLARKLLGDKIGAGAMDVVAAAVQGRWSSSRDLPDGLELAGVVAHIAKSEAAGELDELEDELFRFGRIVAGDAELRSAVTDRAIRTEHRQNLVSNLLEGKASASAISLVRQAAAARSHGFERTLAEFGEVAASRRERVLATVRAAYALDDDEKQRLAEALERQYGHEIHINLIVDPTVIGGLSIEIGDAILDGTVSGRIEDARRRIAG